MAVFLGMLGAGNKKAAPKGLPFVISGVAARRFGACFALLIICGVGSGGFSALAKDNHFRYLRAVRPALGLLLSGSAIDASIDEITPG
nr:hypothetical protein [uncultured Pseudomonas sp.]